MATSELAVQNRSFRGVLTPPAAAVAFAFLAIVWSLIGVGSSADLLAVWKAGLGFASGDVGQVYPDFADGPFTMLPPESWVSAPGPDGHMPEIYPFIYPPLWAWLMSKATFVTGFDVVSLLASFVNPILLVATVLLAHRLAAPRMPQWLFLLAGLVLILMPPIGTVALYQNQPQILVAFLTVFALERAESGRGVTAGALLALAAAIKLYPALIALLWLASGHRRAFGSFVIVGGALGLVSIAVAGWPLHQAFLDVLAAISRSVLSTPLTYTIDGMIGQIFFSDRFSLVVSMDSPVGADYRTGWFVMLKPAVMALAGVAAQLVALAVLMLMFRHNPSHARRAALWPFAMIVLGLLGPISWGYHYIAPMVFLPMLFDRMRLAPALSAVTLAAAVLIVPREYLPDFGYLLNVTQVYGTVALIGLGLIFFTIRSRPSASVERTVAAA